MGTKMRGNWYLNEKLLFMIAISLSIQSAVTLCGSRNVKWILLIIIRSKYLEITSRKIDQGHLEPKSKYWARDKLGRVRFLRYVTFFGCAIFLGHALFFRVIFLRLLILLKRTRCNGKYIYIKPSVEEKAQGVLDA